MTSSPSDSTKTTHTNHPIWFLIFEWSFTSFAILFLVLLPINLNIENIKLIILSILSNQFFQFKTLNTYTGSGAHSTWSSVRS